MNRRRVVAVLVLLVLAGAGGGVAARPEAINGDAVRALEVWVRAVATHAPGKRDVAVETVAVMTVDQRRHLNAGMELFLNRLLEKEHPVNSAYERQVALLARTTRDSPGPDVFLKRAAVLHADSGVLTYVEGLSPRGASKGNPPQGRVPPLLAERPLLLDRDGEIVGPATASWNWPFARSLLDLVKAPADRSFVRDWYHATTAVMLRNGWYADAASHLQRAAALFPDDATILFDRATFAEIQGLPVRQVLLSDTALAVMRAERFGRRPLGSASAQRFAALGIPPPEVANEEAERMFRRALSIDPALVEARIRLGRLLVERRRHDEAASELATALAANPPRVLAFYAHLFSGRAVQALGRLDAAAGHYREAVALFPGAQSARLAQSQAALLAADISGALEAIDGMKKPGGAPPAHDPWWEYRFGAGRDADALVHATWARLPQRSGL